MVAMLSKDLLVLGYRSSSSPLGVPPGYCTTGSKNGIFSGNGKHQAYKGPTIINSVASGRIMFPSVIGGYVSLGDATNAGNGSIIGLISKAMAYIGGGPLYIDGVTRSVNASTALQILLYRAGSFVGANTGPYLAGLEPPVAPQLTESPIASALMSGTYSVVVWLIRSATGGRSRRSPASNVMVIDGNKARIEFPPLTPSRGEDRWGIGSTQPGFGFSGPYYELQEIAESTIARTNLTAAMTNGSPNLAVTGPAGYFTADDVGKIVLVVGAAGPGTFLRSAILTFTDDLHVVLTDNATATVAGAQMLFRSYDFEWASGDLVGKDLAPILDYPPPPAVYACAIEDALAVIGCYGDSTSGVTATTPGTAINVSLPLFPESFPPDNLLFLPEPPVGVLSRASDNFAFIGCKNSMHALTYTGGSPPMSLQSVWANVGVAAQHNMCIAEGGRLYVFTNGKRGPARIAVDNEPDFQFAADVVDDMSGWTPSNVVVGWDNDHQLVCFMHGKTIIAFNSQAEVWCAPLDLTSLVTGNICACVTVNGAMLIATNDGTTMRLYNFNAGTGAIYEIYTPWHRSDAMHDMVFYVELSVRSDTTNAITLKIYKNGSSVTAQATKTITPTAGGQQELTCQRPKVTCAKSHQLYIKQQSGTGDCGVDLVRVWGERSMVAL